MPPLPNEACPDCPSAEALGRLLTDSTLDDHNPPELAATIEHVGICVECQNRMEELATDGSHALVTHVDQDEPPKDSAYWRALAVAEKAATQHYRPALSDAGMSESTEVRLLSRSEVKLTFLQPTDDPSLLGRLGSFDVRGVIGRGGMGVVLLGFDPWLHREVAMKVLDPQLADNEVARKRFCREARAAAGVSHDHLVAVYQVDEDDKAGLPFLVMQLINGESLEQRLRTVGRLSVAETVRLGMQAAYGLAAAHATGLIHRDIKPGNILLESPTDKAKLTDFGLARAAEDLKLTTTGFVAGTPLYMAPEQAWGEAIDARADLFSLGSVMYETLTGRPPFEGRTPLAVLRRVADEAHPSLRKLNPDVPVWLENLIDRLLAKDPANRFQTALEVADALAFKLTTLQATTPANGSVPACSGSKHEFKLPGRNICYKTAGTLAGVFGAGLLAGGVAVALFLPPSGAILAPLPTMTAFNEQGSAAANAEAGPGPARTFPNNTGAVWAVAMSTDGRLLASGVENGGVNVWDMSNGIRRELHPPRRPRDPAHIGAVWAVEFIENDQTLVTASDDGEVKFWDMKSGELKRRLPVPAIRSAAVSPMGNYVAVGDRTGMVWVFEVATSSLVVQYDQQTAVNAVAFAPDGLAMASGGTDGSVIFYEIAGNTQRQRITASKAPIYSLSYSQDGQRLVTASWAADEAAQVWDVNTGQPIGAAIRQPEGAWAAAFSHCGQLFATAGQDGHTRLWDASTGQELADFGHSKGAVLTARFASDGTLITGGQDGTVRVWETPACAAVAKSQP